MLHYYSSSSIPTIRYREWFPKGTQNYHVIIPPTLTSIRASQSFEACSTACAPKKRSLRHALSAPTGLFQVLQECLSASG